MPSKVLVIATATAPAAEVETKLTALRATGDEISLEQLDRLHLAKLVDSSVASVLVGHFDPVDTSLSTEQLAKLAKVLAPGGIMTLREPAGARDSASLSTALTLSGFTSITAHAPAAGSTLLEVTCKKPAHEVGASSRVLSFAKKKPAGGAGPSAATKKVWQISGDDFDDDGDEMVEDDSLLDSEDLAMQTTAPEPEDCSTKKRACKNCSCGRAEDEAAADAVEEEGGVPKPLAGPVASSACGNCYLGDAFRCSSCPYLGMPAFQSGEKVTMSLQPDI